MAAPKRINMKIVKVGILGLGTVGAGVYRLLKKNQKLIGQKSNIDIMIKKVADKNSNVKKALDVPDSVFTQNPDEVISDPDIDIIAELIGGTTVSKELMLRAIRKKKHIVTANKALFAEHGKEILNNLLCCFY